MKDSNFFSGTFYSKKLGSSIEHIKKINLSLTMQLIDNKFTSQLPHIVQVEVSKDKQGG